MDPGRYIAARAVLLHERLLFVATCAERGELDGVEIEAGRLYGMLPRVRVTEVVSDVAAATGFAACFILGENGLTPEAFAARPSQGHTETGLCL